MSAALAHQSIESATSIEDIEVLVSAALAHVSIESAICSTINACRKASTRLPGELDMQHYVCTDGISITKARECVQHPIRRHDDV